MKLLRTIVFWSHLTAGLAAGVVILVMSFTGVVLALKPQILNVIERHVRFVTPQEWPRLGAHDLMLAVKQAYPDAAPASLALDRNPAAAASVSLGTAGTVYVNPYTGAILGPGSVRANQFFQSMTTWHRYMGASGDSRPLWRAATGAANLAFLGLALSGLYIWWPKQLTLRHLRSIVWFRRTSTGRARDFNWHNVIGFWCLPAIVIMTTSGAVISYPWASNLVYRLTGSPITAARAAAPGSVVGSEASARGEGRGGRAGAAGRDTAAEPRPRGVASRGDGGDRTAPRAEGTEPGARGAAAAGPPTAPAVAVVSAQLDDIWARAEAQVPTWSLLSARFANREGAPVTFTITNGANWNKFARSTLTLNGRTGEVVQWQPYEAGSLGQKARGWLRFAHTGELGGLTGQIFAGLGCLGGVFLVCTGISLAFRRFWNWAIWSSPRARPSSQVGSKKLVPDSAAAAVSETALSRG